MCGHNRGVSEQTTDGPAVPFRDHNQITWDGQRVRCATTAVHANRSGAIHGGLLASMLDSVLGGVAIAALPAGRTVVTSSLTVNYLAPGWAGDVLVGSATVRRLGRTLAHVDGEVRREDDDALLATATGVFAILDLPGGANR